MNRWLISAALVHGVFLVRAFGAEADPTDPPPQKANTWVKRSPLPDAPPSPRLGYEASWGYDPKANLATVDRYHRQPDVVTNDHTFTQLTIEH